MDPGHQKWRNAKASLKQISKREKRSSVRKQKSRAAKVEKSKGEPEMERA
jgi:hypothetical protein